MICFVLWAVLLSVIEWIDFIMLCMFGVFVLFAIILSIVAGIGKNKMFAIFPFISCFGG